jgi:hypothetical protein
MGFRRHLSWLRPVAALAGLAVFAGGTVALFTIDNGAGSLFLLTAGIVLILVALLGNRIQIESFEILGAKIRVREVVRSRLQLLESAGAGGDDARSSAIREQALTLQKLVALYDLYRYIRATQPVSDERTDALDELAERMYAAGREAEFDPAEVSSWFHEGDDALRVVALNVMRARPECRDFPAVLETIDEPRSLFEQYYGLELALTMTPTLDDLERRLLGYAVERARSRRKFRKDEPLMDLSDAIVTELSR